jgi:hypothetical protein
MSEGHTLSRRKASLIAFKPYSDPKADEGRKREESGGLNRKWTRRI